MTSNALALRFDTLRPRPELALHRPEQEATPAELVEAPSIPALRLQSQIWEMAAAAEPVEDEADGQGVAEWASRWAP